MMAAHGVIAWICREVVDRSSHPQILRSEPTRVTHRNSRQSLSHPSLVLAYNVIMMRQGTIILTSLLLSLLAAGADAFSSRRHLQQSQTTLSGERLPSIRVTAGAARPGRGRREARRPYQNHPLRNSCRHGHRFF